MLYLKKFMNRMGFSQQELAKLMECGQPRVSAINTGTSEARYSEMVKLLELGMTLEEMFGDDLAKKIREKFSPIVSNIDFKSKEFQKGVQEAIVSAMIANKNSGLNGLG